jgi:hypothetical protein
VNRRGPRWAKKKELPDATVKFAESFEEGNTDDGVLLGSNFDELGNLGDSNEEGEEADIHNEGVNL